MKAYGSDVLPMNPEAKAKWVAALRSGNYVQGKGMLKTSDNTYCCMGVLAEVCGLSVELYRSWLTTKELQKVGLEALTQQLLGVLNDGSTAREYLIGENSDVTPYVSQYFGDKKPGGRVGVSFTRIADLIEREL